MQELKSPARATVPRASPAGSTIDTFRIDQLFAYERIWSRGYESAAVRGPEGKVLGTFNIPNTFCGVIMSQYSCIELKMSELK